MAAAQERSDGPSSQIGTTNTVPHAPHQVNPPPQGCHPFMKACLHPDRDSSSPSVATADPLLGHPRPFGSLGRNTAKWTERTAFRRECEVFSKGTDSHEALSSTCDVEGRARWPKGVFGKPNVQIAPSKRLRRPAIGLLKNSPLTHVTPPMLQGACVAKWHRRSFDGSRLSEHVLSLYPPRAKDGAPISLAREEGSPALNLFPDPGDVVCGQDIPTDRKSVALSHFTHRSDRRPTTKHHLLVAVRPHQQSRPILDRGNEPILDRIRDDIRNLIEHRLVVYGFNRSESPQEDLSARLVQSIDELGKASLETAHEVREFRGIVPDDHMEMIRHLSEGHQLDPATSLKGPGQVKA